MSVSEIEKFSSSSHSQFALNASEVMDFPKTYEFWGFWGENCICRKTMTLFTKSLKTAILLEN